MICDNCHGTLDETSDNRCILLMCWACSAEPLEIVCPDLGLRHRIMLIRMEGVRDE